jgi:hypothetical protein
MGFASTSDYWNQVTVNKKFWNSPWNKITPTVMTAGRWYDEFLASGESGQGYHGNYVRNSGFDSIANWTGFGAGGWAWGVAGTAVHTAGTGGNLTQTSGVTLESGVTYTVIITSSAIGGSGGFQVQLGGGTAGTAITTNTTTIQAVVAGATQEIAIVPNSACTVTIDNFYVIPGAINGQSPRFTPYSAETVQGGIWPGALTGGTASKHLATMSGQTAGATTVPITMQLVDLLGCYARVDANLATAVTFANTLTLPRHTTGAGVRAYSVVAPTTLGANAHNFVASYTNQSGTAGRSFPQTVAGTVSAVNSHISHSGTAANNIGPFLPLQSGDTGVRSIQTWQQTAAGGTASTFQNIVLAYPIMELQLTTQFLLAERDLFNQFPTLPEVQESAATSGACLAWLMYAGAACPANTNFFGALRFAHGG